MSGRTIPSRFWEGPRSNRKTAMLIKEIGGERPLDGEDEGKSKETKEDRAAGAAVGDGGLRGEPWKPQRVYKNCQELGTAKAASAIPVAQQAEPSVLDRLAAEVSRAATPGHVVSDRDFMGGEDCVKGAEEEEKEEEELSALLDKLSKQLEDDPSSWKDLASNLGFPVGSTARVGQDASAPASMLSVQPKPGFVIKTAITHMPNSQATGESSNAATAATSALARTNPDHPVIKEIGKPGLKVFINLCHSAEIPSPPPATDMEIRAAVNAEDNASWKVPMSLAEPRKDTDKAGHLCLVFSACVHTSPYQKAEDDFDFKLFLIELAVEWVEEKSGLKLSRKFQLPKLKSKGTLPQHWIRKESKRKGIAEVRAASLTKGGQRSKNVLPAGPTVISPDYFVSEVTEKWSGKRALIAVIHLPGTKSLGLSASLEVARDSLSFKYTPPTAGPKPPTQYSLTVPLKKTVDVSNVRAKFSKRSEICRVHMPLAVV